MLPKQNSSILMHHINSLNFNAFLTCLELSSFSAKNQNLLICICLRFTEALDHLEEGLGLVNKLGDEKLASYRWPGSQVIIDDTKPGKLLVIIFSHFSVIFLFPFKAYSFLF